MENWPWRRRVSGNTKLLPQRQVEVLLYADDILPFFHGMFRFILTQLSHENEEASSSAVMFFSIEVNSDHNLFKTLEHWS